MKRITYFRFDDGDIPSPKQITEAFNLLREFCPALVDEKHPVCKAFHCVVDHKEFTFEKWSVLYDYAQMICRCAEEKYLQEPWNQAPWRSSILDATANMRGVIEGVSNRIRSA